MRALIGKADGVTEKQLPIVGFFAAMERALSKAEWVATMRDDGTPDYIWGNAAKAREYLAK